MTLNNKLKEEIKKEKYFRHHIFEIMYYCDEFAFVTVIMLDDKIFRLNSIEEFIEFYNLLKENEERLEND